jgi:hypothetical protein
VGKLTRKLFRELVAEQGILAAEYAVDGLYLRLQEVIEGEGAEKEHSPSYRFMGAYCEAFKAVYGTNPHITGAAAGMAKNLLKSMGLDQASDLVRTYLTMKDPFFVTKGHDLPTFVANINKVKIRHDTGKQVTRHEANRMDQHETNKQAIRDYLRDEDDD